MKKARLVTGGLVRFLQMFQAVSPPRKYGPGDDEDAALRRRCALKFQYNKKLAHRV